MESFVKVYIPMIFFSLVFAYLAMHGHPKRFRKILWFFSAVPPILVAAFRYDNGADYLMYDRMFQSILQTGRFVSIKAMEIGFEWLIRICQVFTSNSLILFGVCAVLIVSFYYKGIFDITQIYSQSILGLILFYATGTYFDSFNGIRQYLAAAIVFWAFKFIIRGEFKKWSAAVCCAALFHYTALIMIPFYFTRKLKFNIKRSLVIIVASWFSGIFVYNLVSWVLQFTRYRYFLTSVEYEVMPTASSTLYTCVLTVLAFVSVLLNRNSKYSILDQKTELLLNMQVFTTCTTLFSWTVPLMWRVQYYFLPMEMVIVPCYLELVPKKIARNVMKCAVVTMYSAIIFYGILVNDWFDCVPWNFYFIYR